MGEQQTGGTTNTNEFTSNEIDMTLWKPQVFANGRQIDVEGFCCKTDHQKTLVFEFFAPFDQLKEFGEEYDLFNE